MKTIAVIPARYQSSRFPGKPLSDLCGYPMIWWVYNQVKKVNNIESVYVATDDQRILEVCKQYDLNAVMTRSDHGTSTERVYEVAKKIPADLYVVINGDEPLIDPNIIKAVIPQDKPDSNFYVSNLMTEIKSPVEAVDLQILRSLRMKNQMHCFSQEVRFRIRSRQLIINIINMLEF